jgi:hypothetical protein
VGTGDGGRFCRSAGLNPSPGWSSLGPRSNHIAEQSIAMNDSSNTTAGLDQADEEILTYTVSDDALEAVAGIEGAALLLAADLADLLLCCVE